VPHYLFDVARPDQPFDASRFLSLSRPLAARLWAEGRVPILVGGTGLYLKAFACGLFPGPGQDQAFRRELRLLEGQGQSLHAILSQRDPEAASRLNPRDRVRLERALEVLHLTGRSILSLQADHAQGDRPFSLLCLIADLPVPELDRRIRERTEAMFRSGLMEEARALSEAGWSHKLKPLDSIGYRECLACLRGEMSLDQAKEAVRLRTRQLAKRQRTWFRGQMPEGLWLKPELPLFLEAARQFMARGPSDG
jgi:tRNA dimethylallyltransferase